MLITAHNAKHKRNFKMLEENLGGYRLSYLLKKYGISKTRFYQIRDSYKGMNGNQLKSLGASENLITRLIYD